MNQSKKLINDLIFLDKKTQKFRIYRIKQKCKISKTNKIFKELLNIKVKQISIAMRKKKKLFPKALIKKIKNLKLKKSIIQKKLNKYNL